MTLSACHQRWLGRGLQRVATLTFWLGVLVVGLYWLFASLAHGDRAAVDVLAKEAARDLLLVLGVHFAARVTGNVLATE
jgi:hypothetical protein